MSFTISINDQAAFEVQFAGPAGPTGPQGPQGIQGVPGQGVASGGTTGQVLKKLSGADYDTGWSSDISGVAWGGITGTLSAQTDLQTALDAKLSTSAASSTYLPLAGGYITGDIQSLNGSEFRTFQSTNSAIIRPYQIQLGDAVGTLTVDAGGITFNSSPYKQTAPFLGLDGYATESWVTAGFYPLTGNPSGFLTSSALTGYATESWVTSQGYATETYVNSQGFITSAALAGYATETWVTGQLGSYLPLSGGAMTGSITSTGTTHDTEMSGEFFGVQLSSDHTQGTMLNYDGLHTYDGPNSVYVKPTGITFSDSTVQTTAGISDAPSDSAYYSRRNAGWEQTLGPDAPWNGIIYGRQDGFWVAAGGGGTWGSITGTLSDQTDLQAALDAKYDASNPAGFITAGDLTGYATESWVTSQGYLTTAILDGYAQLSGSIFTGVVEFDPYSQGRIMIGGGYDVGGGFLASRFNLGAGFTATQAILGDFWFNGTNLQYADGSIPNPTVASQSWVTSQGYATIGQLSSYAPLAGATFTGKVNLATISTSSPSVNLGGQCDSAPAAATNGDLWISNAVAPKLTYRMGGVNYNLPVLNQFNTFTNQMVIDTTSATTAALRVTQRGAGNAIEVEDSTTPDATRFVVDQFGKVGIGVAPDTTAAIKIDGNGMSFNGLVFNPTATSAHTGGSDTLDLLVTINGTPYRLGLRPA
ncbi:hypothetical protein UFOVP583_44 [uncultured Caudovirales phage]|uniref:Uncharacterized protein n=1 Tax=uncultured Caudovirales phage TaxID=2100421 RepID=A0A6J5N3S8_9CAUD|nr:hypothetical protein UFOVP583_44 [uncultured Caudovirales phage]